MKFSRKTLFLIVSVFTIQTAYTQGLFTVYAESGINFPITMLDCSYLSGNLSKPDWEELEITMGDNAKGLTVIYRYEKQKNKNGIRLNIIEDTKKYIVVKFPNINNTYIIKIIKDNDKGKLDLFNRKGSIIMMVDKANTYKKTFILNKNLLLNE